MVVVQQLVARVKASCAESRADERGIRIAASGRCGGGQGTDDGLNIVDGLLDHHSVVVLGVSGSSRSLL